MQSDFESRLEETIRNLEKDLAQIRTGRATASMVEDLKIEAYESALTLKELASITVPEPRQLLITPWDKSVLKEIEKGLQAAGFNPAAGEEDLRIVFPPLTGEEREKLMREVGERAEEAKVSVRNIRRDEIAEIERAEKEKEISEDDRFTQKKIADETIERFNRRIDEISQEKKSQLEL